MPDAVSVRFGLDQQTFGLELLDELLAAQEPVHAGVGTGFGGHPAVVADDGDARQAVAAPRLVIVRVVRRRDLDDAGAEVAVDETVGDDR